MQININKEMNPQTNQSQQSAPVQQPSQSMPSAAPTTSKRSFWPWLVLVVVIVVLAVVGFLFRGKLMGGNNTSKTSLSGYQAVFLTNGQVYFGKLSESHSDYITLKDIYYLQVNQQLQSGTTTTANNQQPQLSLVKLGNELHGPDDTMHISKQQVLFYEDLKADGKVAQAIQDYIKNGSSNQNQTPAASQTPATTPPVK